jgi:hypothetical protein
MNILHTEKKHIHREKSRQKGVVLLIAVIISSLVLVLGIGILNILTKEIVLSSLGKNSRTAFFAADAGIECAMYWDLISIVGSENGVNPSLYPASVFATSTDMLNGFLTGTFYGVGGELFSQPQFNPFCANQDAADVFDSVQIPSRFSRTVAELSGSAYITRFYFFLDGPSATNDDPCTLVTVTKELVAGKISTSILSEGFSSCNPNDVRRVSRGIRVDYEM